MQEFFDKKITDLTVIEALKYAYLVSISSRITMNLDEFCKVIGKDKRSVYNYLKNRIYPEEMIMGGYDSMKQRKSPIFITEEVLNFIR